MTDRFERFTERAKKVLVLAQEEAQRFNHNYIGTEHLLIGLAAETQGVGARLLAGAGVDVTKLREALAFSVGRGAHLVVGDISLTPRAKRVVEQAAEEARGLNHNYVGTEHLLLALAYVPIGGISVGMLERCGVNLVNLRETTLRYLATETERLLGSRADSSGGAAASGAAQPPRARDNVVTCRVDDPTLNALDALVEAGVHTTRSEAAARLIRAGIQANQALFERVYEAVGEIRRVRAETQVLARMLGEPEIGPDTSSDAPPAAPPDATPPAAPSGATPADAPPPA
jgi:ATP-dependent Clp protease ATP-binding subunit ClpA